MEDNIYNPYFFLRLVFFTTFIICSFRNVTVCFVKSVVFRRVKGGWKGGECWLHLRLSRHSLGRGLGLALTPSGATAQWENYCHYPDVLMRPFQVFLMPPGAVLQAK